MKSYQRNLRLKRKKRKEIKINYRQDSGIVLKVESLTLLLYV